jgi:hypothetical protein
VEIGRRVKARSGVSGRSGSVAENFSEVAYELVNREHIWPIAYKVAAIN